MKWIYIVSWVVSSMVSDVCPEETTMVRDEFGRERPMRVGCTALHYKRVSGPRQERRFAERYMAVEFYEKAKLESEDGWPMLWKSEIDSVKLDSIGVVSGGGKWRAQPHNHQQGD